MWSVMRREKPGVRMQTTFHHPISQQVNLGTPRDVCQAGWLQEAQQTTHYPRLQIPPQAATNHQVRLQVNIS